MMETTHNIEYVALRYGVCKMTVYQWIHRKILNCDKIRRGFKHKIIITDKHIIEFESKHKLAPIQNTTKESEEQP